MNKIKILQKVLGIFLIFFIFSACVDVLDEIPSDKVDIDRLLDRRGEIEGFRNQCYLRLPNSFTAYSAGQLIETYTDDAFNAGTGNTFDWHSGLLSPNNTILTNSIWDPAWEGIRRTNLAILYIPQHRVNKELLNDLDMNRWIDEVKIIRVWLHFILIKNFGPLPFIDHPISPGFVGWDQLTRPTYEEITTRIVEEIDEVISNGVLPLRQVTGDYSRINMAVAYALKSKVLLYNASLLNNSEHDNNKWQKAASAAQECLNAIMPEYQLVSIDNYTTLFNEPVDAFNREIILRSTNNSTSTMNESNGVDLLTLGSVLQNIKCGAVPTQEFVDCFELLNGSLPVVNYNNDDHTDVTFSTNYNENLGDEPYVGRDARFYHAVVFNGAKYGKYKGLSASKPELTIYTYEGKSGTGLNNNPTSDIQNDLRRSCTGYYSRKFRSAEYWGSQAGGTNSYRIFFRLAEVYLNLAEAQCELNNLDAAISALNVIRTRAGQPQIESVPGFAKNKDFLMKRIRNERRVELCFEGHRFYDQRRWKILDQSNQMITGMKINSSDGTDNGTFSFQRIKIDVPRNATTEKYLVLPLSIEEARRLPGIGQPDVWK